MDLKGATNQQVLRDMRRPEIASPNNSVYIGWRTGVNYKIGKNVRIDKDGYEHFSDYFTSPEGNEDSDDSSQISSLSSVTNTFSKRKRSSEAHRKRAQASIPSFFLTPLPPDVEESVSSAESRKVSTTTTSQDTANASIEMVPVVSDPDAAVSSSPAKVLQVISNNAGVQSKNSPTPKCFGSRKTLRYSRTPVSVSPVQSPTTHKKSLTVHKKSPSPKKRSIVNVENESADTCSNVTSSYPAMTSSGSTSSQKTQKKRKHKKSILAFPRKRKSPTLNNERQSTSNQNSQTSANGLCDEADFEVAATTEVCRPVNLKKLVKDHAAKNLSEKSESCKVIQKRGRNQRGEKEFPAEKRISLQSNDSILKFSSENGTESLGQINPGEVALSSKSTRRSSDNYEKSVYDLLPDDNDRTESIQNKSHKTNKGVTEIISKGKKISKEVVKQSDNLTKEGIFKKPCQKNGNVQSILEEVTAREPSISRKSAEAIGIILASDEVEEVTESNFGTVVKDTSTEISKSLRVVNGNLSSKSGSVSAKAAMRSFGSYTDIATLPCTPEFLTSNVITSTPLTARRKSFRDKSVTFARDMLISRTTLGNVGEETSVVDGVQSSSANAAMTSSGSTSSQKSLKKRKHKKSILAFPRKRKHSTLRNERQSSAGSVKTPDQPALNYNFSLAVDGSQNFTGLPRFSTASPLHYFEVTHGESNPAGKTGVHRKIIVPEECDGNLRRSKRTRVMTLEEYRGERIKYEWVGTGFVIAGIESPVNREPYGQRLRKEINRQLRKEKRMMKLQQPRTPRNLSIHVEQNEDETPANPGLEIPVLDRDANAEVLMECIKVRDQFKVVNSSGQPAADDDPLTLCKPLRHPSFSSGFLTIRPLQCKELQSVKHDTMVFSVFRGKVELTIHRTQQIVEASDIFVVPKGNNYSIRNLRNDEAKLFFVQVKN